MTGLENSFPKRISLFWWVCVNPIFFLEKLKLFFFLLCVHLLECPVGIVVQHHEVSVAHVEPRQVVTGVLGIEDVLVDHVGCSSGLRGIPNSDLPDGPVFPKNVVHLLGRDFVRQVPDVQDPVDLRREPDVGSFGCLHRHAGGR